MKIKKSTFRPALFSLALLFLTNCDGALYHPDHLLHVDIKKLTHKPEELIISDSTTNQKLAAWYLKSPQESKGIVIVFHGNAQNLSSHFYSMYWIVDEGYDLFIFDYPGYGASPGVPTPQNTIEAGHLAVNYVRKKWPNKPYIIVGQSLGGAIATRTIADMKDRSGLCAMVIDSSFLSYKKIGRDVLSRSVITWPFQWASYIAMSDKYAPKDDIKKISPIPLLVIHRRNDPVIPIEFGEEIFEKANRPKDWMSLPGGGHVNAFTDKDQKENQKKLLEFLKVCNR